MRDGGPCTTTSRCRCPPRRPDPPDVLTRPFDPERDTEGLWHLLQGAYADDRGPPAAVARGLEGEHASTSRAGIPTLWIVAHDAQGIVGAVLGEKEQAHRRGQRARRRPPRPRPRPRAHAAARAPRGASASERLRAARGRRPRAHRRRRARCSSRSAWSPRAAPSAGRRALPTELERLAARAREEGRLGIDTEFMPEGRYRPLLCLVQVCVGEEVVVLDPIEDDLGDPAPLAAVLADPAIEVVLHAGRQDVAILRRAWSTDVHQRLRHPDRGRLRGLLRPGGLHRAAARRAADPAREVGLVHALGRAAADARAAALRPRGRRAPAPARRRAAAPAVRPRPARVGARGVPRDRRRDRRARPRGGLAAAAAHLRARRPRPRGRPRAGRLARAHRRRRGPPRRLGRARPDARRAGQARPAQPEGARPDPRRRARRGAPPRPRDPRRDRARPRRRADPPRRGRAARPPTRSTARRSRWPRRWSARARRRPASPTS